jgi:hypothetical protein
MIIKTIKLVQQGLACQQFALYIACSVRDYRRTIFVEKTQDKNKQKIGKKKEVIKRLKRFSLKCVTVMHF